ncbi:HAMP domain-containing histidine kinase [Archangium violaceum]|uniref:sensor histidine kinase n=1 Tax=Archangium violaceum TaxID=83451 RepID=UPI00193B0EF7|nr:HAMP domain-containing sensor histidine kinase [Archangium violaceum]QRK09765.1 HAMP domain-containing histidine kinase [Archangium violaceum]
MEWQQQDLVVRFANRMAQLLRESIGRDASDKDIEAWVELAIARQIGLRDGLSSLIRTLELDRLAGIARTEASVGHSGYADAAAYAAAIRATRGVGDGKTLTPIGRVFLELAGRDAIRWLLHVEAEQSFGPNDPWRVSRQTASELVRIRTWSFDGIEASEFPYSWASIERLEFLGLVAFRRSDEAKRSWIEVLPMGLELLAEISRPEESAMAVLASSLIADLTLSAANEVAGRTTGSVAHVQASAVAEATARHSRMVAHEVRNMLVPVKTAVGALYREVLLASEPGGVVARRREEIDRGIDSVFRFISQLVELSNFAGTPPEPFELLSAIRDAVSAVESESRQRIEQVLPATLPPVSGHRARVVLALTNVLRNAAQSVPSESPVIRLRAEALEGASAVRISIEDNGPGVPEEMRRAVFEEGISLRGSSGLGLALVREVIEKEMKGLVACDASPLGGARFVMRISTTGMERP